MLPEPVFYLIGQRVIVKHEEIGIVVSPETENSSKSINGVWVHLFSKGYASCFDPSNVKPLPNGQL